MKRRHQSLSSQVFQPRDDNPRTQQKRKLAQTQVLQRSKNLKEELKFNDVLFNPTIAGTQVFSGPTSLSTLSLGTDATNRIGRKVVWTKIIVRHFYNNAGAAAVRLMIVYDKQPNGALPAITDVLLSDTFTSNNNLNNRDRFITILDEIIGGEQGDALIGAGLFTRKINLETIFNSGNTGTISDIQSGSIFVMAAAAPSSSANSTALVTRIRLRYLD